MSYRCFVCRKVIEDEPHTYHGVGCPARQDPDAPCIQQASCGEDVHPAHCPTCTGGDW